MQVNFVAGFAICNISDYEKVYNVIMNDIKSGAITSITFDRFNM